MRILFFLLLTLLSSLVACSKSNDSGSGPSSPASPFLSPTDFVKEGCLNLQSLTEHVNNRFNFPSRATTINFSTTDKSDWPYLANSDNDEKYMRYIPYLRSAKQTGCTEATISSAYGRDQHYDIVLSGPEYVILQHHPERDEDGLNKLQREALKQEPALKRLRVEITSPSSLVIEAEGELLFSQCAEFRISSYQKKMVLRWGDSRSWPTDEGVDPAYLAKVEEVRARYGVSPDICVLPF